MTNCENNGVARDFVTVCYNAADRGVFNQNFFELCIEVKFSPKRNNVVSDALHYVN